MKNFVVRGAFARRIVSGALAALFVLQSTGAASAAPVESVSRLATTVVSALFPPRPVEVEATLSRFPGRANPSIVGQLSTPQRLAQNVLSRPVYPYPIATLMPLSVFREHATKLVRPYVMSPGVRAAGPLISTRLVDPKDAPRDPLAMGRHTLSSPGAGSSEHFGILRPISAPANRLPRGSRTLETRPPLGGLPSVLSTESRPAAVSMPRFAPQGTSRRLLSAKTASLPGTQVAFSAPIPGNTATDITVGADGSTYYVGTTSADPGDFHVYRLNGTTPTDLGVVGNHVAGGANGDPWVTQANGTILHYVNGSWNVVPSNSATNIAVGADGTVYYVGTTAADPGDYHLYRLNGSSPTDLGLVGNHIAGGPGGDLWATQASGSIYHLVNGSWQVVAGNSATNISVGLDGTVYYAGTTQAATGEYHIYRLLNGAPTDLGVYGDHLAGGPNNTLYVLQNGNILHGMVNGSGVNPWWTYENGVIPGLGKYMVNVSNTNVVVQSSDVDIPERGIDLAFTRTYNSLSARDWANDDGSAQPGQFGSGWTNSFDAHLAYNTSAGGTVGLSVFDADGARYDYLPDGQGHWIAPAGVHAQLTYDGSCAYDWTQPSGTIYRFFQPSGGCVASYPAYGGRTAFIYGRNHNNYLYFIWSFASNNVSSSANLASLTVQHSDGHALVLNFGTVSGQQLLTSLVRPDGVSVTYRYDGGGNLLEVDKPLNNSGLAFNSAVPNQCVQNGAVVCLPEKYGYYGPYLMQWAAGPHWALDGSNQGEYVWFNYNGNQVTQVGDVGVPNPVIVDGVSNTPPQPSIQTTWYGFKSTFFVPYPGFMNVYDTDGHVANWFPDSVGRVTQHQGLANAGGTTLYTYQTWDAQNNLTEAVDARGNATDYAYDLHGNTIAVAAPSVTTSAGRFRPTGLYSYDGNNNLTASCDAVFTHALGRDWTGSPGQSDSLCANQPGAVRTTWDFSDAAEPFGRPSDSFSACYHYGACASPGSHVHYSYDPNGLVTQSQGEQITQADGSITTPTAARQYDAFGNVTASNGVGNAFDQSTIGLSAVHSTYDGLNRAIIVRDGDGAQTCSWYNPDGTIAATETPAEHALVDSGVCNPNQSGNVQAAGKFAKTYSYDANSNETSETTHFGCTQSGCGGTTKKWYDGADRLVEVALPHDASDRYSVAWLTRYLYDLSQNGQVSVKAASGDTRSFGAHGNLFSVQTYLPTDADVAVSGWRDSEAFAHDALDRTVTKYLSHTNRNAQTGLAADFYQVWEPFQSTYDVAGAAGLLGYTVDPLQQKTSLAYDALGNVSTVTFNDSSTRSYTYDPESRVSTVASGQLAPESYVYDADGRVRYKLESSSLPASAILTYSYNADGTRAGLSVASSAFPNSSGSNLLQYSYTPDAMLSKMTVNYPTSGLTSSTFGFNYTVGRRLQATSDPRYSTATSEKYQNGVQTSHTIPEGTYTYSAHDAEGEVAQETGLYGQNITLNYQYNVRGELYGVSSPSSLVASAKFSGANGFMYPTGGYTGVCCASYDPINALKVNDGSTTWTFDAAGRESNVLQNHLSLFPKFDSENHLSEYDVIPYGGGSLPPQVKMFYKWTPSGHLSQITGDITRNGISGYGATATETLHWDGDQLLFTTNGNGQLDDLKIGVLADITTQNSPMKGSTPAGLIMWDREPNGKQTACHRLAGNCTWLAPAVASLNFVGSSQRNPDNYGVLYMSSPNTDSMTDGYNTFLGTRTIDPSLSQWTTPDADPGSLDDPTSLKPYVVRHNNENTYHDPSGNKTNCSAPQGPPFPPCPDSSSWDGFAAVAAIGTGFAAWLGGLFSSHAVVTVASGSVIVASGGPNTLQMSGERTLSGNDPGQGDEKLLKELREQHRQMPTGSARSKLGKRIEHLQRKASGKAHGADKFSSLERVEKALEWIWNNITVPIPIPGGGNFPVPVPE